MLRTLFTFSSPVSRRTYATVGFGLALFKYVVDASLIYAVTGRLWRPVDLLVPLHFSSSVQLNPAWLFWALGIWTLPFIWIGASMTLRRAIDAGWSPWLGLGFFVPILNYVLMLALCVAPSKSRVEPARSSTPLVDNRFQAALVGVAVSMGFALAMLGLEVYLLHGYGASLFFGTPIVMGALTAYIQNRGHARSASATAQTAIIAVLIAGGAMLLFALEGAVCVLMALPMALIGAMLGSWMGRAIALTGSTPLSHLGAVLLLVPLIAGAEASPRAPAQFEVVSSIDVDAPQEQVWPHVVGFDTLPPPNEWLFRTGIAYPVRARIDRSGIGAIRHCEFTTGPFVEPVTTWEPPARLSFDVTSEPDPMEEWSPYSHIRPPHLDGYFRAIRGEFRLVPIAGNRTRLEGSTWYTLGVSPTAYWRLGAEFVLHTIHQRVLRHIKRLAENDLRPTSVAPMMR